ncbi:ROK family transcriptional regulator [Alicyclobacillus macrosporangiidus]|uniref:ROK family protein (Putative glucokinase) n=1 Tax=Alicyclobacillus macrosporangiidus TaxID=392015 RepID=A0A1I7GAN8_9BACL|nr:ROK family transcriptional regulator [Alicyclobacillus macrosporangiidus]SFU45475.1 ROK family protein (putative glucokinase) [Alicyclobacillus macrosporangiidus]
MTRTGDQAFIKALNRSIVLNLIRTQSPISRTQIAKITGLNKATVSALVDELIQDNLVQEVGHGHARVGRRPVLLLFNADAGHVIGMDLGVNYIRVLATDLAARARHAYESPLDPSASVETNLRLVVDMVRKAAEALPPSSLGIVGIGIGVPGLVDYDTGTVINAPNLRWSDLPLRERLERELQMPVFVDNEANAGALGEKLFGSGKDVSDLVYVSVGIGIGTGIIVGGELMRGRRGLAGEFGHMTVETAGARCSCGNTGCLELYASEAAVEQMYLRESGRPAKLAEIQERLAENDAAAISAVQAAGYYLGVGVANIINGLNPSMVVIGNRVAQFGDWLLRPVEQAVQNRSFVARNSATPIRISSLGRDAIAVGAAALVLHHYFSGP